MSISLSERERRFVEAYLGEAAGNGTHAARLAGYSGSSKTLQVQASRLLSKAIVQSTVTARAAKLERTSIADAAERREILSSVMRAPENPAARIKAIDVANKMDGLYVEKHTHTFSLEDLVGASRGATG